MRDVPLIRPAAIRSQQGDCLRLDVQTAAVCGGCDKRSVCNLFTGVRRSRVLDIPVVAGHAARQFASGEQLGVSVQSGLTLPAAICYLLVPVLLLLGAWLGSSLGDDAAQLAGAGGGLAVGALLLRRYDAQLGPRWRQRLRLVSLRR